MLCISWRQPYSSSRLCSGGLRGAEARSERHFYGMPATCMTNKKPAWAHACAQVAGSCDPSRAQTGSNISVFEQHDRVAG